MANYFMKVIRAFFKQLNQFSTLKQHPPDVMLNLPKHSGQASPYLAPFDRLRVTFFKLQPAFQVLFYRCFPFIFKNA